MKTQPHDPYGPVGGNRIHLWKGSVWISPQGIPPCNTLTSILWSGEVERPKELYEYELFGSDKLRVVVPRNKFL